MKNAHYYAHPIANYVFSGDYGKMFDNDGVVIST